MLKMIDSLKSKDIAVFDNGSPLIYQLMLTFSGVDICIKKVSSFKELHNIDVDFLIIHNEYSEIDIKSSIREDTNIFLITDCCFEVNINNLTTVDVDTLNYINLIRDMYELC
jgi:hypothetical protein